MKRGIDISQWQGTINFAKVKDQVDFVILREGYRQTIDSRFLEYVKSCKSHGILIHGVYHFLYSLTNLDALAEAKSCITNVKKADLPKNSRIWCDLEYDTIENARKKGVMLGKTEVNQFTRTFCDYILSKGYRTGIYTNGDYYKNYYEADVLKKYPIWLADYTGEPDYDCVMQQYSSKGVIDGISGSVDMDYCFCGDHEELGSQILSPQKVVEIALGEVGYVEKSAASYKKDPSILDQKTAGAGSDNYTKYGRDMHNLYPSVMDFPAAWCDAFVDWCFQKAYGVANAKSLLGGNFDDYTVASAQLYKNKKAWHKTPQIGDQVFFTDVSGGICHTGLVVAVDNAKKIFITVEGNTSSSEGVVANGGAVAKKTYYFTYSRIAGFGRPLYGQVSGYTSVTELSDSSSFVKQAQIHLNNFVNAGLQTDGEIGPLTKTAYRRALQSAMNFDLRAGLEVDGDIGTKTRAVLRKVVLRKGSSGHLVTVLEIGLLLHDLDPHGVECPGIFGNLLREAVGKFQEQAGLTKDFEAGYDTFLALQK